MRGGNRECERGFREWVTESVRGCESECVRVRQRAY